MEFDKTQTFGNLARSFAGESQAGLRYQFIAQLAMKQGYKTLSDEIKYIARNETAHAKIIFNTIIEKNGNTENIDISAGYPFEGDTIENGLLAAAEAEAAEIKIYRQFSETAANEGFKDISDLFLRIADVEERHETIFRYLYENFRNGTLFSGDKDIIYECSNCGFRFTAKQAFSVCPLCKVSQGFVKIKLPE